MCVRMYDSKFRKSKITTLPSYYLIDGLLQNAYCCGLYYVSAMYSHHLQLAFLLESRIIKEEV